jgi:hypothetical protein
LIGVFPVIIVMEVKMSEPKKELSPFDKFIEASMRRAYEPYPYDPPPPPGSEGSIWAAPREGGTLPTPQSIWASPSPKIVRWSAKVIELPVPKWTSDPDRRRALAEQAMSLALKAQSKLRRV